MRLARMVVAFGSAVIVGIPSGALAVTGDQRCVIRKLKAATNKVAGKVKCHRKAFLDGTGVDAECLLKVEDRFTAQIAKADNAGSCAATASGIEADVDAFVATLVARILPAPTTTTTTATTTTTTTAPTTTTTLPVVNATVFEFGFDPDPITIPVGGTVRWTNVGEIIHTSTGDQWDSGILDSGDSFEFTFTTAGSFDYFCTVHPGLEEGTVIVQE